MHMQSVKVVKLCYRQENTGFEIDDFLPIVSMAL
jgi:hypothetical protein